MVASHVRASPLGSPNNPVDPAHFAKVLDVFFETDVGASLHPDDLVYRPDETEIIFVQSTGNQFVYRSGRPDRDSDKEVLTLFARHKSYAELQETCLANDLMTEEDLLWVPDMAPTKLSVGPFLTTLSLLLLPVRVRRTAEELIRQLRHDREREEARVEAALSIKHTPIDETKPPTIHWVVRKEADALSAEYSQHSSARKLTRWGFTVSHVASGRYAYLGTGTHLSLLLPTFLRILP